MQKCKNSDASPDAGCLYFPFFIFHSPMWDENGCVVFSFLLWKVAGTSTAILVVEDRVLLRSGFGQTAAGFNFCQLTVNIHPFNL